MHINWCQSSLESILQRSKNGKLYFVALQCSHFPICAMRNNTLAARKAQHWKCSCSPGIANVSVQGLKMAFHLDECTSFSIKHKQPETVNVEWDKERWVTPSPATSFSECAWCSVFPAWPAEKQWFKLSSDLLWWGRSAPGGRQGGKRGWNRKVPVLPLEIV